MTGKITLGHAEEGSVDIDINKLVDSRMLIQGNSGGGKSYLLRLVCERVAGHVPFIVLDSEGEFASLREKVDAILIGPEGDVPTDLRSAALLARKLVELRISAIIDLYELKPHHRREYVRLFLNALVELPRELWHPTLIILDEAHKFAPEKGQGDSVSTQSVIDLMSLGRKRGFAGVLATQRFSKLHNDAIAETNNVFIGRTWMDADQKRAGEYLGLASADRRLLRDLKPGEFYAFGPALSIPGVIKFKGDKVATSHPKPGERHKIKPPKASDAISQIVSQIEDLPEVAEQEKKDLESVRAAARQREAELKTEIAALKRELSNAAKPVVEKETKLVFPEEKITELQDALDGFYGTFSRAVGQAMHASERIEAGIRDLRQAIPTDDDDDGYLFIPKTALPVSEISFQEPRRPQSSARIVNLAVPGGDALPEGERKVLTAIAQYSDRDGADREQITILTGYKRSTRDAYIQRLGIKGFLEIQGRQLFATDRGFEALGDFEPLPTGQALRDYWMQRLPEGEMRVLSTLCANHPQWCSRDFISIATEYKRSTRDAYIQRLATRKLVETGAGGVRAVAGLF